MPDGCGLGPFTPNAIPTNFNYDESDHGKHVYSHVDGQVVRNIQPRPTDPMKIAISENQAPGFLWQNDGQGETGAKTELGI